MHPTPPHAPGLHATEPAASCASPHGHGPTSWAARGQHLSPETKDPSSQWPKQHPLEPPNPPRIQAVAGPCLLFSLLLCPSCPPPPCLPLPRGILSPIPSPSPGLICSPPATTPLASYCPVPHRAATTGDPALHAFLPAFQRNVQWSLVPRTLHSKMPPPASDPLCRPTASFLPFLASLLSDATRFQEASGLSLMSFPFPEHPLLSFGRVESFL